MKSEKNSEHQENIARSVIMNGRARDANTENHKIVENTENCEIVENIASLEIAEICMNIASIEIAEIIENIVSLESVEITENIASLWNDLAELHNREEDVTRDRTRKISRNQIYRYRNVRSSS